MDPREHILAVVAGVLVGLPVWLFLLNAFGVI
jgi:hypothetical protein